MFCMYFWRTENLSFPMRYNTLELDVKKFIFSQVKNSCFLSHNTTLARGCLQKLKARLKTLLTGNYPHDVSSSSCKFQLNPITGRVDIDVKNCRCFPHSHSLAASCLQVLPCKPMQTACDCVENIGDVRRRYRPFPWSDLAQIYTSRWKHHWNNFL